MSMESLSKRRHLIKDLKELRAWAIQISERRQVRQNKPQVQKPGGRAWLQYSSNREACVYNWVKVGPAGEDEVREVKKEPENVGPQRL